MKTAGAYASVEGPKLYGDESTVLADYHYICMQGMVKKSVHTTVYITAHAHTKHNYMQVCVYLQ